MALKGYYDRYDSSKKYVKSLFLAGKGLQSAELNEVQDYAIHGLREFGDALFKDGDVISGCTCVVDGLTGATTVEAGKIYLDGAVRVVGEGILQVPVDTTAKIGVYYKEKEITELEDPALRDPALGTRNYQEAGAGRVQYSVEWGVFVDGITPTQSELGDFYSIYNVVNGIVIQTAPAPQLDSVSTSLARYDNESNGSYVVKGMSVSCISSTAGQQVISIGEGKCHVNGYEVELTHSLRKNFPIDPDLGSATSDPYLFYGDANGNMTINLHNTPIEEITRVSVTIEKTVNITHGAYSGVTDALPDTSILSIISVSQNATTYTSPDDYIFVGGALDWSPTGAEPATGSSYTVTYRYIDQVEPTDVTDKSFVVHGAVDGTNVLVDYTYRLPRYDIITVDYEGNVYKVKGLSQRHNPSIPFTPTGQLKLADIYQTWFTDAVPTTKNNAIKAVLMSDLENLKKIVSDIYYTLATQQLKNDANASDPAVKKGIFVDSFLDDDMRDQGISQTASIMDGELRLPIATEIHDLGKTAINYLLPYTLEPVITQGLYTGSMKINPYQAFDPIPAEVDITLNVDRWTTTNTSWLSPVTVNERIMSGGFFSPWTSFSTSVELVNSVRQVAEFMRVITQNFKIEGFKANEELNTIMFDNLEIEAQEK